MSDIYNELYDKVFLENKLTFLCFDDLYIKRDLVRKEYLNLPVEIKRIYKWYFFYQLCIMNYGLKSAMWEYINHEGDNIAIFDKKIDEEYEKLQLKREKLRRNYEKKEDN